MNKQVFFLILLLGLTMGKLKMVAEIYRHGARGSIRELYDGLNQTDIAGQLTGAGQRQHYNLGGFMREEYIKQQKFLPERYNHSLIYVRADDVDRTIMSAYSHFQGMYPEGFGDVIPENLPHEYTLPPFRSSNISLNSTYNLGNEALPHRIQVLPVHVVSKKEDKIFLVDDMCPNYDKFHDEYKVIHKNDSDYVNAQMKDTFKELTRIFNVSITKWSKVEELNDVLQADLYNGRVVPQMPQEIWRNISFMDDFSWFFSNSGSLEAVQIETEPMLQEILGYFNKTIAGKTDLKWLSYSGHDDTVAPLMRIFNFTTYQCLMNNFFNLGQPQPLNCAHRPIYAAQIIMELHESDNAKESDNYVRLRYNGEYMNICDRNSTFCDYKEFQARVRANFAPDFNQRCGNNVNQAKESLLSEQKLIQVNYDSLDDSSNYNQFFLILLLVAQSLVIVYLTLKNRKNQNKIQSVTSQPFLQNYCTSEVA